MKAIYTFHKSTKTSRIKNLYTYRIRFGKPVFNKVRYHSSQYNREGYLRDKEYWGKVYMRYFRFRYSKIWGF